MRHVDFIGDIERCFWWSDPVPLHLACHVAFPTDGEFRRDLMILGALQAVAPGIEATCRAPGDEKEEFFQEVVSGVECESVLSPQSMLGHFLRSADAVQAKDTGSQQLSTLEPQPDEQSRAGPSPSQPQLDGYEPEATGCGKEAASSCPDPEGHAPEAVGKTEAEIHSELRKVRIGESSGGVAVPTPPSPAAVEPSQRHVSTRSAPGQRRPSSALEIARRLRRTPASKSGADASDAKSGTISEAKSGADAGRCERKVSLSGRASEIADAAAASSGLGITVDAKLDQLDGSVSISRSADGSGKVQSKEDSAAGPEQQAVSNAHTSVQNEQNDVVLPGAALADVPKATSDRAAGKALHTMSYLPLAGMPWLPYSPYQRCSTYTL